MKHFEPIVIQEETEVTDEVRIEPAIPDYDDVIDIVWSNEEGERIGLTIEAATRLRDALNTILNN